MSRARIHVHGLTAQRPVLVTSSRTDGTTRMGSLQGSNGCQRWSKGLIWSGRGGFGRDGEVTRSTWLSHTRAGALPCDIARHVFDGLPKRAECGEEEGNGLGVSWGFTMDDKWGQCFQGPRTEEGRPQIHPAGLIRIGKGTILDVLSEDNDLFWMYYEYLPWKTLLCDMFFHKLCRSGGDHNRRQIFSHPSRPKRQPPPSSFPWALPPCAMGAAVGRSTTATCRLRRYRGFEYRLH
uniref:Uncharacterized protein n=1 Tax=Oryza meridionalis TaxID=40149 RepID=A0A0E0EAD8_9ORYZ